MTTGLPLAERADWAEASLRPGAFADIAGRWYAPNTREPIRDETLRSGLILLIREHAALEFALERLWPDGRLP